MDKKNKFRKSLLSSAILAATLKTLSASAVASTCPPPNTSGNVHVAPGSFCQGGVTVDSGAAVNDIGVEGKVVGNIVNDDGMSDFWMDFGTLDGSFINNGSAQDVNVANGSEIYADIRNNGDMRYITITDGPGADTVVHGSVVNTGGVIRVHVEGIGTRVGGDIVNADGALIADVLMVNDGAIVSGNIYNNGSSSEVIVDGASTVENDVLNDGNAFVVGVLDGSSVGGDFINNGDAFYFVADSNSSVDGSMINTGYNVFAGVVDGSTIAGDFGNEGGIDGMMMVEGSTVEGNVYNGADGYTAGIQITDSSTVGGNVTNSGDANFLLAMDDSSVAGDVVNTDTGYIRDGITLIGGVSVTGSVINDGVMDNSIQLVNDSSVGTDLVNNGDVFVDPDGRQYIPDASASVAGIKVDDGSMVEGNVVNNGNLIINFLPSLPPGLGHSLAGISVDHGSSVGDIVNTGTIEVTAGLEHNGPEFADGIHANGIQVKSGSTSGSIVNDGDLLADTFGIYVDGSGNDGVTVEGSVVNAIGGTILTQDNGIYIKNSEVTGDLVNEGLINSSNDNAIDIEDSVIGGSVVNTGSLVSNEDYDAIDIDDSTISGDVVNTMDGEITGEDGIDIDDSMVVGSVVNAGTIIADDEGFDLDQITIGGDFANTGLIEAGRVGISIEGEEEFIPPVVVDGQVISPPDAIIHYATIGGNFKNSGEIISGSTGIEMEYVDIAGDFDAAAGSIEAGLEDGQMAAGIDLSDVLVGGNMLLGDVSASGTGVNFEKGSVGGDFATVGDISAEQGNGVFLRDVDVAGNFIGVGDIQAGHNGIDIFDVTIAGAFENSGDVTTGGQGISIKGNYYFDDGGVLVTDVITTVGGSFNNSGDIVSGNHGIVVSDASIGGGFTNSGDITTGDGDGKYSINIEGNSQIGGDIVNSGDLTGGKGIRLHGTAELEDGQLVGGDIVSVAGGLLNSGTINSSNDAIRIVGVDLGGALVNTGDIYNTGSYGIDIDDAIINGNIENHGLLDTTSNNAIDINGTLVNGHIINTGTINSSDNEGIDINSDTLVTGSILNTGTIIADSDAIIIYNSHIQGSIINDGTIIAAENDAIDIHRSNIDGSVINNGVIRTGYNAFEIDGNSDNRLVIGGNLENNGEVFAIRGDGVTGSGSDIFDIDNVDIMGNLINTGNSIVDNDGFDIGNTSIGGSLLSSGSITAGRDGYDIDDITIAGDWINSGAITAGDDGYDIDDITIGGDWINSGPIIAEDSGFDVDGSRKWHSEQETSDGVTSGYYTLEPVTVGGRFINRGDIDAGDQGIELKVVSIGTNGITADGAGNFENSGNISAGDGSAMDLDAVTVAGDFINTGNLDAQKAPDFEAGDVYYKMPQEPVPDGQVVLSGLGEDQNSNAWFAVKNESDAFEVLTLTDEAGNFSKTVGVEPGQEVLINAGEVVADTNYTLSRVGMDGQPQPDGQMAVSAVDLVTDFTPPYQIERYGNEHRGISLTGYLYGENTQNEQLVKSSVGGHFVNTGTITAVDQGIYLKDVDIGGTFENSGDITSATGTGIDVSATTIGGSFINIGDINAAGDSEYKEGDHYYSEWSGEPFADGNIVLVGRGRDEQGNAWFVVRNESDNFHYVDLNEENGGFNTQGFGVAPGEEMYVNAGQIEGDLALGFFDGESVVTASAQDWSFSPQPELQHGISLVDTVVGGDFGNSGDITSNDHGISLQNMSVAGNLVNSGDIAAEDSAINVDGNVSIGGSFNNSGDLSGKYGINLVSSAWMDEITSPDGVTLVMDTTDGVITVGGELINTGNINTESDGIRLRGVTLGGGLGNFGDITTEDGNTIELDDVIVDGNIENHGVLTVQEEQSGDGIDIDDSIVKGSVINFGTMNIEGTEGFDIDNSIIEGSVVNAVDGVLNVRSDGFYIENTHIKGSLVNQGTIAAKQHDGIDIQVDNYDDDDIITRIDGSLISTGNITAGDNGFELDGEFAEGYTMGTSDGVQTVPARAVKLEIGGQFYNSGDVVAKDSGIDLELVSVGANGVLEDGQANFENHGNVTASEDSVIKLVASDVAGDFINSGDLSTVNADMYFEGDQYSRYPGDASPDGELTLTAVGADEEGNAWFLVKNDGQNSTPVVLTEENGDFSSDYLFVEPGQEIYVTAGKDGDGSENYVLSQVVGGPFGGPVVDGEIAATAADLASHFQPAYKIAEENAKRGISLTSKVYDQGGEFETLIKTTIGGNFVNSGNIAALNEGIYLNEVDVGGSFFNQGDVESLTASAIDLSDITIGGDFVNSGDLRAAQDYTYEEGDSYRSEWDGVPSEDGDLVLLSQGVDEEGNQWFVIRNESDDNEDVELEAADGDFVTTQFTVKPGEEVYINAGELAGDLELKHLLSDGVIATAGGMDDGFSPEYNFSNGISIENATVGGYFANSGTIDSMDEGIYLDNVVFGGQLQNTGDITSGATGVELDDVSADGGLLNTGNINAGWEGIFVADSALNGEVRNEGDITAFGSGIHIADTMLNGAVVNTGNINVSSFDDGYSAGMQLHDVDGVGDFVNHGTINVEGNQWSAGMGAGNVNMDGIVANTGTINAEGLGIALNDVHGATGLINSGTITSTGTGIQVFDSSIDGDVVNTADGQITVAGNGPRDAMGMHLDGVVGVNNFVNHGAITTAEDGWGAGMMAEDVSMSGVVGNTGMITSDGFGMALFGVDGATGFVNEGEINTTGPAMLGISSSIDGDIVNGADGVINSEYQGIFLGDVEDANSLKNHGIINVSMGDGITVFESDFEEDVVNTGDITAGRGGITLFDLSARNVVNTGNITAGTYVPPRPDGEGPFPGRFESYGNGIQLVYVDLGGSVLNQGSIDAATHGVVLQDGTTTTGIVNNGSVTAGEDAIRVVNSSVIKADGDGSMMTGHIVNGADGVIVAGDDAIRVRESTVQGNIENHGVITAGENAIDVDNAFVNGNVLNAGSITSDGTAIELGGFDSDGQIMVDGAVVNSGSINTRGLDDGRTAAIGLVGVVGVDSVVNTGTINAGTAGGADNEALGIGLNFVEIDGEVGNTGTINSHAYAIAIDQVDGITNVVNQGDITTQARGIYVVNSDLTGSVANSGSISSRNSAIYLENATAENVTNSGDITVSEGHGIKAIDTTLDGDVVNTGNLSAGHHGISLDDVTADGSVLNAGTITAGLVQTEGNGIEVFDSTLDGQIVNGADGDITAAAGGIVLDNTSGITSVANAGTISAGGVGIDINAESNEFSVGGLTNTGTITAEYGPAVRVTGATVGQVVNAGTITGGVIVADAGAPAQISRDLNTENPVAFDFRNAGGPLNILNGTYVDEETEVASTGIINGDVYGSGDGNDLITMAAGELNGDVYDVENIDITGSITLNNNVFSFNDSSTVTVKETGALEMGVTNTVNIQGDYKQEGSFNEAGEADGGDLTVGVNINERGYDDARIKATGEAVLDEGSTITVTVVDRNIGNLDTTDGGANLVIIKTDSDNDGGEQVTNNGVALSFAPSSDSILLNSEDYISTDGTEFGTRISISDLGELAGSGGADVNASNALAALQGLDSAGLVELYESNPDLYNAIYNGSEASLATLAEQIVASPENGIAAGQAAQAEAVNTILTRIAELRTGASGISAGDDGADSNIRPDSLWMRAIYSDGEQDATSSNGSNFNSYSLRSKGFTIGADKDVSDTLTLGVGVSVVNSTANEKNSSSSAQRSNSETDTYLGSVYAGWRDQDYFVDASVNFGKGGTDLKGSDWEADYDSTQLGVSVMGGKSFLFNNNDTLIEPRVGFNYTRLETDKYSYQSNGENINIGSQNLETVELGAGVRFVTGIEVGNGLLLPEASVMAWHDFKGDEVKANVEFETGGGSFNYVGPKAEKNRYQAGVGVEYLMDNNFTLSVNYDHNWQDGFKADTWVAKVRYDF